MPVNRIVKMHFQDSAIERFLDLFDQKKATILAFPGCRHLELWQDNARPGLFFTYSIWDSESDLENYRQSPFFAETWKQTKALFKEKAEAWTVGRK